MSRVNIDSTLLGVGTRGGGGGEAWENRDRRKKGSKWEF